MSIPSTGTGSAFSTTVATASPACADDSGTGLVTNQACSSGSVTPDGVYSATMALNLSGQEPGDVTLASIATPSVANTWRSFGARAASGVRSLHGHERIGCVAAGARRTLGAVTAGGLASASGGDIVPAGFTSMVQLDGFSAQASAEAGITPERPAPPVAPTLFATGTAPGTPR